MSDIILIAVSMLAGGFAGVIFFGGLWLTVRRIVTAEQPALLMLGSLFVRAAVVIAIFYVASNGALIRLVACLVGFLLVRIFMIRYLRQESRIA